MFLSESVYVCVAEKLAKTGACVSHTEYLWIFLVVGVCACKRKLSFIFVFVAAFEMTES